jgi:hypothetical protein
MGENIVMMGRFYMCTGIGCGEKEVENQNLILTGITESRTPGHSIGKRRGHITRRRFPRPDKSRHFPDPDQQELYGKMLVLLVHVPL